MLPPAVCAIPLMKRSFLPPIRSEETDSERVNSLTKVELQWNPDLSSCIAERHNHYDIAP